MDTVHKFDASKVDNVMVAANVRKFNADAQAKAMGKRISAADTMVELIFDANNTVTDEIWYTLSPLTVKENGVVKLSMTGDIMVNVQFVGLNKADGMRQTTTAKYGKVSVIKLRVNVITEQIFIATPNGRGDEIGSDYVHEYRGLNGAIENIVLSDILINAYGHAEKFAHRAENGDPVINQSKNGKSQLAALLKAKK